MPIDFIEESAPTAIDFVPEEPAAPKELGPAWPAQEGEPIAEPDPERERKREELANQMRLRRAERSLSDAIESFLGGAARVVEPLTPAGLMNQPTRIAGAIAGKTIPDIYQAGQPLVNVPQPKGTGFLAGLGQLGAQTLSGLTTPEMVVTAPAFPVSGVARALTAGEMAATLPESISRGGEVLRSPEATVAEKVVAAGQPLVTAAMVKALTKAERILPQAAEAAKEATKGEITDASEISKAAEVYGDVRTQPVEGVGQVPVEESRAGVQPQAEGRIPETVTPPRPAPESGRVLLTSTPLFHGSFKVDLTELKPSKIGDFGSGIYLSTDPDFAGLFAKSAAFDISPEQRAARGEGKVYEIQLAKQPKKIFSDDQTPLTTEEKAFWKNTETGIEDAVNTRSDLFDERSGHNYGSWEKTDYDFNSQDWDAFLNKFGYDAVSSGKELMLRDKSAVKIKSTPPPESTPTVSQAAEPSSQTLAKQGISQATTNLEKAQPVDTISRAEAESLAVMPRDPLWQLLQERGINEGGAVRVVNEPTATWFGRTVFETDTRKPVGVVINSAKVKDAATLHDILEHEGAHWYDLEHPQEMQTLMGKLSDAERATIQREIAELGYGPEVHPFEQTAAGLQRLADSFRGRNWFERVVANVMRFASEKLGLKPTRLAAEKMAARALVRAERSIREAKAAEVPEGTFEALEARKKRELSEKYTAGITSLPIRKAGVEQGLYETTQYPKQAISPESSAAVSPSGPAGYGETVRKHEAEYRQAQQDPVFASWEAGLADDPRFHDQVTSRLEPGLRENSRVVEEIKRDIIHRSIRSTAAYYLQDPKNRANLHFTDREVTTGIGYFLKHQRQLSRLLTRSRTWDEFTDEELLHFWNRSSPDMLAIVADSTRIIESAIATLPKDQAELVNILRDEPKSRTVAIADWSKKYQVSPGTAYNRLRDQIIPTLKAIPQLRETLSAFSSKFSVLESRAAKDLTERLKTAPKAGTKDAFLWREKAADAWAEGKSIFERAVASSRATAETLKDTARGVRSVTDLDRRVGELDWLLQQSAGQSREMKKAMLRQQPSKVNRESVALWIDAGGDVDLLNNVLHNLPAKTKPNVRRALQRAVNLPPEIADFARQLQQFYGARFQDAHEAEIMDHALDNYFTHVWKKESNMPEGLRKAYNTGKINEYFPFSRERKLPMFLNGIMEGKHPLLDPAEVLPMYNYFLDRSIASRKFVKELSDIDAPDGRPAVLPWGTASRVEGPVDESGAMFIRPRGRSEDSAQYLTVNHPAMHKWKWVGRDNNGNPIFMESDLAVNPTIHSRIARMMDKTILTPSKVGGALLRASTEVKGFKLGLLSAFHQVHVGSHALFHWTNPFKTAEIDWESPAVRFAVEKGHLKIAGDPAQIAQFSEGLVGPGLVHKTPIVGPWSKAYSEWLFTDYIPRLKLKTFENALNRNMEFFANDIRAGKITAEQVAARVGDAVNSAYGELNHWFLGKQGRSPQFQRILRGIFLAPDFGEARLRFVEKAFTKYGHEERLAFATMFLTLYVGARVANWLSHGDPETDLKNAFRVKVKIPGKDQMEWVSMRSVVGDLAHALTGFGQFMYVRLNPLYSRTISDILFQRDVYGRKLSFGDIAFKRPAQQLVPINFTGLTREDQALWESAVTSAGLQVQHDVPALDIGKLKRKWLLSNSDPKLKAMGERNEAELFPPSDYSPLRRALLAGDMKKAGEAYDALKKEKGKKHADILEAMKPFTGGKEDANGVYHERKLKPIGGQIGADAEKKFLASLTPAERRLYTQALEERKKIYARFLALMKTR